MGIHHAAELVIEIAMYILATWVVLWILSKISRANQVIENAKYIPGGMYYTPEEPAKKELEYPGHA